MIEIVYTAACRHGKLKDLKFQRSSMDSNFQIGTMTKIAKNETRKRNNVLEIPNPSHLAHMHKPRDLKVRIPTEM